MLSSDLNRVCTLMVRPQSLTGPDLAVLVLLLDRAKCIEVVDEYYILMKICRTFNNLVRENSHSFLHV